VTPTVWQRALVCAGYVWVTYGILSSPLRAQDLVINEVLTANHSESLDDDDHTSDWVELTNVSPTPVQVDGYGLSDDPQDPFKWVLRQCELEPGEFWRIWCSGKDRNESQSEVLTDPARAPGFRPLWISTHDEWTYRAMFPEEPRPERWQHPDFDDNSWAVESPNRGLDLENAVGKLADPMALMLRRTFFVTDPARISNLVFTAERGDRLLVYLNGELVGNAKGDEEKTTGFTERGSSPRTARVKRLDLSPHRRLLRTGENVLAILAITHLRNRSQLFFRGELGRVLPVLHTNFKLSKRGREGIYLTRPSGERIDAVSLPLQTADRSYGRFAGGSPQFRYLALPTPGQPNSHWISETPFPTRLVEVHPPPGRHSSPLTLEMVPQVELEGMEIRYTIDGSRPVRSSPRYTQPLRLTEDTALRTTLFVGETALDETNNGTYYGLSDISRELDLPVLAIVMDPEDFRAVHLDSQARGRESERPGMLEVFDDEGQLAVRTGFGLRLHGGAGRVGDLKAKKAYKAYFRRAYGLGKLVYPLIEDTDIQTFDKLVLRANFNDAFRDQKRATLIRDQLSRDLYQEMGALISHGSWRNLFINGEYRGLYNLVERMDEEFLESYQSTNEGRWDVIKTRSEVLDGSIQAWNELRSFMRRGAFADAAFYDEARRRVDVANFTSYMILNVWQDNHDWPQNNWYVARPQAPDGRWIFLSWDAEFGLGLMRPGVNADTFQHVLTSSDNRGPTAFRILLTGLLENDRYRKYFVSELDRYLAGVLSPENVVAHVDRLAAIIRPDVKEELTRTAAQTDDWEANLEQLRNTILQRGPALRNRILSHEGFTFPYVTAVEPNRIVLHGEHELVLRGVRFTTRTGVLFGSVPARATTWISPTELRAVVPLDSRLDGVSAVTVTDSIRGSQTTAGNLAIELPASDRFLRGDVNADGRRSVADVVAWLGVFQDLADATPCADAGDVNDSGRIDLADAVTLLEFIFRVGPAYGIPFFGCERDVTADDLDCSDGGCVDV
jgi:hypothetical protein